MRNVCSRVLLMALMAFIFLSDAVAQQRTTFIEFTNTWRYNNTRTDLGTGWRALAFDDLSWSSGPGLLGADDTVPLPYSLQHSLNILTPFDIGPANDRTPTVYFRTHFTNSTPGNTLGLTLIASNLVDDACIIYLNGTEAARIRATNAAYSSYQPALANEGRIDVTNINPALLRVGDNVVAVQVHQTSATSSDLVYGLRLMLFRALQLTITNQPQSQTIIQGQTAVFNVGVSGGPAFYQWQRDEVNIPGATSGSTINGDSTSSHTNTIPGRYRVIITNLLGSVTSLVATLTVTEDFEGPKLVAAVINNVTTLTPGGLGSNTINLIYSEKGLSSGSSTVFDSPRNTNNFRLVPWHSPNSRVGLASAQHNDALDGVLNVVPTDPNWFSSTGRYYLVVNNVADGRGNRINPYSVIGVSRLVTTNLTQMSQHWDFYSSAFFDPTFPAIYRNEQWYKTNFVIDPNLWGTDPSDGGIYWFDNAASAQPCAGDNLGRNISYQDAPVLFRRTFQLPTGFGSKADFRLRFMVDDGMVVYLNGVELMRYNMPSGPVNETTRALATVTNPTCTNALLTVTNLLPGTNWLAAAVYQGPASETDTYFGLEMDAVTFVTAPVPTNPPAPYRPTITRERPGNSNYFVLSWPTNNYGFALRYSTNIIGSNDLSYKGWFTNNNNWIQVRDQSNPYTNFIPPSTGPRRFYQLFRSPRD